MARITEFIEATSASARVHPTTVECGWQTIYANGETLVQLSTYGSDDRQSEKKVSQTLQIDRGTAAELLVIIRRAFPGL